MLDGSESASRSEAVNRSSYRCLSIWSRRRSTPLSGRGLLPDIYARVKAKAKSMTLCAWFQVQERPEGDGAAGGAVVPRGELRESVLTAERALLYGLGFQLNIDHPHYFAIKVR